MTLFSYEIFDAVARQGSFNKAAQQLHLTPSAISHKRYFPGTLIAVSYTDNDTRYQNHDKQQPSVRC